MKPPPITIPVDGKVVAQLKGVTLDTVLDIVGQRPFQRLGLAAQLNGPANATWTNGDVRTLQVSAKLDVSPPREPAAGEVPANGTIDGTYFQRDGSVDLRTFFDLLAWQRVATRTDGLALIHSQAHRRFPSIFIPTIWANLIAFCATWACSATGKSGTSALPVSLGGQAEFHGTWSGSLADPHLAGTARATNLAVELPPMGNRTSPQLVHWDAAGSDGHVFGSTHHRSLMGN